MRIATVVFSLFFIHFCVSCGGGGSGGEGSSEERELEETITRAFVEFFGTEGHLWKPRADEISSGAGNLVVLLGQEYSTQFDSCEVPLSDGSVGSLICINNEDWTQIPFSCFSNGNRQTWRANFTCDQAARIEVTCRDADRVVTFTVPDAHIGRVCERF